MKSTAPRPALLGLLLCLLALLAYSNSFQAGFTLDSRGLIVQDSRVHAASAASLDLILRHSYWWPYGESGLYRPVTTLTYLFNYAVLGNGTDPAGYHWINFLLHAGNILLLYCLLRRLLKREWSSFFGAALWAVHPALTESVTNIVGRADLLASMALLGGLLLYLNSAEAAGPRRWVWLGALALVAMAGVFCKENAAVLPVLLVLYEVTWWKERQRGRALLIGCAATAPALVAMVWLRHGVFAGLPPTIFPFWDNPLTGASFWTGKLTALQILGRYLALLVWPARLSTDYSYHQIPMATGAISDWLAWLEVAAAVGGTAALFRRNRVAFFLAGAAFLAFLPSSNLLFSIGTIMAERFLYLPAAAFAVCVVLAVEKWCGRSKGYGRLATIGLAVVMAALGLRTWMRNADWHDEVSITRAAVRVSPQSYKGHKLLAAALFESLPHSAENLSMVLAEAEKGLAILDPLPLSQASPEAYQQAALYYLADADLRGLRSTASYQRALELLGRCKAIVEAEGALPGTAAELDPAKMADLERALAYVQQHLHDTGSALESATSAIERQPKDPAGYGILADTLLAAGRPDDAAVTLIEGTLITNDMALRQRLVNLYQQGLDPGGCALMPGPNGPAINPNCETVHRHTCDAVAPTMRSFTRMARPDLAAQLQTVSIRDFHCAGR